MKTLTEVRFVTANFFNLQGLRTVPFSLCLVFVCIWANGLIGAARSFLVPILLVVSTVILVFIIDRYYLHTFGRVQRTPESRRLEWIIEIAAGILALGAFWLDASYHLPVSLIGLVFGIGLLVDYIRITWLVKGRFLFYYPLGAVLMIVVSVLPLLGFSTWWHVFGIKNQLIGISMLIGIFSIFASIWGHFFLVHTLSSRVEIK